jgi:hypothetical protein
VVSFFKNKKIMDAITAIKNRVSSNSYDTDKIISNPSITGEIIHIDGGSRLV